MTPAEVDPVLAMLAGLPDWHARLGSLTAAFAAPSTRAALDMVAAIGAAAKEAGHHPDVDWRRDHVFVRVPSRTTTAAQSADAVTAADVALAGRISVAAAHVDARSDPAANRSLEIGVDTADPATIAETWAVTLGYRYREVGDLVDPWGRGPTIWFQRTDSPNPSRLHLDAHVVDDVAPSIVTAAQAAGGRLVDERFVPSFWVVADRDGNRLCVCTPAAPPAEAPEVS